MAPKVVQPAQRSSHAACLGACLHSIAPENALKAVSSQGLAKQSAPDGAGGRTGAPRCLTIAHSIPHALCGRVPYYCTQHTPRIVWARAPHAMRAQRAP